MNPYDSSSTQPDEKKELNGSEDTTPEGWLSSPAGAFFGGTTVVVLSCLILMYLFRLAAR